MNSGALRVDALQVDVLVVGGGPAGSVAARELAREGFEVLVLERDPEPRARICGEYLCPSAVRTLEELELREAVEGAGASRLSGMLLVSPSGIEVDAGFPCRADRDVFGLSLSRTVLDPLLLEHAEHAGASVRRGVRVHWIGRESDRCVVRAIAADGSSLQISAALLIGADGRFSTVARSFGLTRTAPGTPRGVVHAWLRSRAPSAGRGQMHLFADGSYVGVDPLPDGRTNVSWVVDLERMKELATTRTGEESLRARIESSSALRARYRGAELEGSVHYLAPLRVAVRSPIAERVLLVGDAGGFLDPLTGEGLHVALASARLAASTAATALRRGLFTERALRPYAVARRRLVREKLAFHHLLQWLLRHPRVADGVGRRLVERPSDRDRLLGVIGNVAPARDLLRPSFLWSLLRPSPKLSHA